MSAAFMIFVVGLLYVVIIWGQSFLRRDRLSPRFAYEGLALTGLAFAAVRWGGLALNPIIFLLAVYLITMRARLLLEVGNLLGRRGRHAQALTVYRAALGLVPDRASRLVVMVNMGAALLNQGDSDQAIALLEAVRAQMEGVLGPKYAGACRYNLAAAYRRQARYTEALGLYNEIEATDPVSNYARLAAKARQATLAESGLGGPRARPPATTLSDTP